MIRSGWRLVLRLIVTLLATGGIALVAWLRPFAAEEPALAAMHSDSAVTVLETPTRIVLEPAETARFRRASRGATQASLHCSLRDVPDRRDDDRR